MENLVIVESPAKARTLGRFLGDSYHVEASMGHLVDLPKSKIGVDTEGSFAPQYVVMEDKSRRVGELTKLAKEAKHIFLATDPDREGEAIAWHLLNLFAFKKPKKVAAPAATKGKKKKPTSNDVFLETQQASKIALPYERVVFHEITESAVKDAFAHPRKIDDNLVDAQQARRVLDRVVGYKLSPLLWRKVRIGLSAGRVQSVALRLIVDREREIAAFNPEEYWSIAVELSKQLERGAKELSLFVAMLIEQNFKKIEVKNRLQADAILAEVETAAYKVQDVRRKEARRQAYPPFTTSTLQQNAANRLGFTAKKTMKLAQTLYEEGYITYMRTDSMHLAASAVDQARSFIAENYGREYVPEKPKLFTTKSKVAQEAHEAIRPTNVTTSFDIISKIGRDETRLYDLIWKRFVSCQMADAVYDQTQVDVLATPKGNVILGSKATPESALSDLSSGTLADPGQVVDARMGTRMTEKEANTYLFRANGSKIKFPGWLLAFAVGQKKMIGSNSEDAIDEEDLPFEDKLLPALRAEEPLDLQKVIPEQHFTQPPPRYTEAGLIKALEANDIGRPSTYAPIISTILDRQYADRIEKKLVPTAIGFAVTDFLVANFADILNLGFTAQMEGKLDAVANGQEDWVAMMKEFYKPFEIKVASVQQNSERVKIAAPESDEKCPKCNKQLLIRTGRFGKFLGCSGFPECDYKTSFAEKIDMKCPNCKEGDVVVKYTKRHRPFYGCSRYPECKFASWNDPSKPGWVQEEPKDYTSSSQKWPAKKKTTKRKSVKK